jgi:hypothetical protein
MGAGVFKSTTAAGAEVRSEDSESRADDLNGRRLAGSAVVSYREIRRSYGHGRRQDGVDLSGRSINGISQLGTTVRRGNRNRHAS